MRTSDAGRDEGAWRALVPVQAPPHKSEGTPVCGKPQLLVPLVLRKLLALRVVPLVGASWPREFLPGSRHLLPSLQCLNMLR